MFKHSQIKNLNKFKLFATSITSAPDTKSANVGNDVKTNNNVSTGAVEIMSGYTSQGLGSIDISTEQADLLSKYIGKPGPLLNQAMAIFGPSFNAGNSLCFDIARKNVWMGSRPIQYNFDVYLFLENDYKTDIVTPLTKLFEYMLPTQSGTEIFQTPLEAFEHYAVQKANEHTDDTGNADFVGTTYDFFANAFKFAERFVGEVRQLNVPVAFDVNKTQKIGFSLGKSGNAAPSYIADEVYITSLKLTFPPIIYVDWDGNGLFDHVKVSFGIETARVATYEMLKKHLSINI